MANEQNHLIELLPRRHRQRLLALSERVDLMFAAVLCEPGMPLRHVYFPIDGFISLLAVTPSDPPLEVGMIGREGMLGSHSVLGVAGSPLRALVQGAGSCLRVPAAAFRAELLASPALRGVLLRYVHVCMQQLTTSAVCLRFHQVGPRLARWLLMTQDRAHREQFHITQEFLAAMLGVRRVGVTRAAGALQQRGLIAYRRGAMQVLDRAGLEGAACSCYSRDLSLYSETLD